MRQTYLVILVPSMFLSSSKEYNECPLTIALLNQDRHYPLKTV